MKVIRHGYEKEVVCPKCKASIVYESSDVHMVGDMEGEYFPSVKCPDCNHYIELSWKNL